MSANIIMESKYRYFRLVVKENSDLNDQIELTVGAINRFLSTLKTEPKTKIDSKLEMIYSENVVIGILVTYKMN